MSPTGRPGSTHTESQPRGCTAAGSSLTVVAEAGAGTADGEQQQAGREDQGRADPGAAVGGRADRPGSRGGPGFEQAYYHKRHVSHRSVRASRPPAMADSGYSAMMTTTLPLACPSPRYRSASGTSFNR